MNILRLYSVILVVLGVLLSACGSDSGSNLTPSQELSSESNSQNKNPGKKNPDKPNTDTKVSDALVTYDSLRDIRSGEDFGVIRFGKYIWMANNASDNVSAVKSVCYEEDDENCSANGRLYQSTFAVNACPNGFHIPTAEDWEALRNFIVQNSQLESSFNISLGGYCTKANDSLACKDLGNAGWYMMADNRVATLTSVGHVVTFSEAKQDAYYSLRCVDYTYIAAQIEDLPVCDSLSAQYLKSFYVTEEKTSFRCTGKKWVNDFSNDCNVEGISMVAKDTMYICKYGKWQVAHISDSRDSCTEANEGMSYTFNGVAYVCKDNSWEEFSPVEKAIGLCVDSLIGKIDSIENVSENLNVYKAYICDSTGWRTAGMVDFVGECDSTRIYEEVKFKNVGYVCRKDKWNSLNELEQELGVCSPKKQGKIDTTHAGMDYICDNASWRRTGWLDYVGECNAERLKQTASYANSSYMCLDTGWHRLNALELEIGICSKDNLGKFDTTKTAETYVCDSAGWRITEVADYYGICDSPTLYKIVDYDGKKYYCSDSSWKKMTDVELTIGFCTSDIAGKCEKVGSDYYCCDSDWIYTNSRDARFGKCNELKEGKIEKVPDTAFVCKSNKWSIASVDVYAGKCDSSNSGRLVRYIGQSYSCRPEEPYLSTRWEDVSAYKIEGNLGYCTGRNKRMFRDIDGVIYKCDPFNFWTQEGPTLHICDSTSTPGETLTFKGSCGGIDKCIVTCDYPTYGRGWKIWTAADTIAGTYCSEAMLDSIVESKVGKYICDNSLSYYRWVKI